MGGFPWLSWGGEEEKEEKEYDSLAKRLIKLGRVCSILRGDYDESTAGY
jgi:hypothetical protein